MGASPAVFAGPALDLLGPSQSARGGHAGWEGPAASPCGSGAELTVLGQGLGPAELHLGNPDLGPFSNCTH